MFSIHRAFLTNRLHYVPGYHNPDTTMGKAVYRSKKNIFLCLFLLSLFMFLKFIYILVFYAVLKNVSLEL